MDLQKPNKIRTYVGFAIRAGKAVFGVDQIKESRKRIRLILADLTLSPNGIAKLERIAEARGANLIRIDGLPELCARPACKALGIAEESLAKAIEEESRKIGDM